METPASIGQLAAGGILSLTLLIVLIARFKLHAFLALLIASLAMGMAAGMPLLEITKSFQDGLGAVLSTVAPIVALGAILGKLLMDSGGASVLARRILRVTPPGLLPWAMLALGLLVGAATWFAVGLVILAPILFGLYRETRRSFITLALPMICGLSVMHGFVPPHPGPVVAIDLLKADLGKVILLSLVVGVPTAMVSGPLLAYVLAPRLRIEPRPTALVVSQARAERAPNWLVTLGTILFPIVLMLLSTAGTLFWKAGSWPAQVLAFIGAPAVAMLLGVLLALWTFGARCGFERKRLSELVESSLGPIATVLLVVGAGGGFSRVLLASGVGKSIAGAAAGLTISPLILAWLAAALIRVATGSATVAITTAAGIMIPILQTTPAAPEAVVIAMAAGSLTLSHLNDGGFWFAKEYLGLTVAETLKSWTIMETVISVVGLGLLLLVERFF